MFLFFMLKKVTQFERQPPTSFEDLAQPLQPETAVISSPTRNVSVRISFDKNVAVLLLLNLQLLTPVYLCISDGT